MLRFQSVGNIKLLKYITCTEWHMASMTLLMPQEWYRASLHYCLLIPQYNIVQATSDVVAL